MLCLTKRNYRHIRNIFQCNSRLKFKFISNSLMRSDEQYEKEKNQTDSHKDIYKNRRIRRFAQ